MEQKIPHPGRSLPIIIKDMMPIVLEVTQPRQENSKGEEAHHKNEYGGCPFRQDNRFELDEGILKSFHNEFSKLGCKNNNACFNCHGWEWRYQQHDVAISCLQVS